MINCYIHSAVALSAQTTFGAEDVLRNMTKYTSKTINVIAPNYRDFIPPSASRRMATGVKMGVVSAKQALILSNLEQPDAIITGTGMGCIEDTEKFLNSIIANKEDYLTPTSFIQSTHNTVGAQIALGLKCHGYNDTYVHASASFESAVLDALLLLNAQEANNILVGGVDELGKEIVHYVRQVEDENNGIQVPFGEGASFFVLSNEKKSNTSQLLDIKILSSVSNEALKATITSFLNDNQLETKDIDAIILGNNGDVYDSVYSRASSLFPDASHIQYKHLVGEYFTASAFGFWLADYILKTQDIPSDFLKNNIKKQELSTVLIYNQFKGKDHSFILLRQ